MLYADGSGRVHSFYVHAATFTHALLSGTSVVNFQLAGNITTVYYILPLNLPT